MAKTYLVVNVDSDPDPVSVYQDDVSVLVKYARMKAILGERTGGASAWTVLTGSMYRDRFFDTPYVAFWQSLVETGAELVLHPEEDLYGPGPGTGPDSCTSYDTEHMSAVIRSQMQKAEDAGIAISAYRGGYHGFTPQIGQVLKEVGIGIELSCAPRIVWPEKAAAWGQAPLSAYYMAGAQQDLVAGTDDNDPLFEIPWAWDGVAPGTSRPFVVGENYIINEFSNLPAMQAVWDAIVRRAAETGEDQIVSMVCHTYTMGKPEFENRLMGILDYIGARGGQFVSPTRAKAIYDANISRGA